MASAWTGHVLWGYMGMQLGVVRSPDDIEQVLEQAVRQAKPGDHRVPTQIEEGCGLQADPDGRIWVLGFPAASGPLSSRLARRVQRNCFRRSRVVTWVG